jgi:GntR family transcriptional regulator
MFTVDSTDPTPLYAQIERGIRAAIAARRLRSGDRLPTVRQLAVDLRVNANTVAKVYAELERAGVLATQRGIGTFVRDNPTPHPTAPTTRRDRERELRPLVDRLLADASAIGISLPEIVAYIKAIEGRHTKEKT